MRAILVASLIGVSVVLSPEGSCLAQDAARPVLGDTHEAPVSAPVSDRGPQKTDELPPTSSNIATSTPGRSIKITGPITVADRPFFHGSGFFALGGLVGGLIATQAYKDEPERIAAFVREEKIPIAEMVRTQFERQLSEMPGAVEHLQSFGSASFRVFVFYGITSVPLTDGYRPYMVLRLELVDPDGKILWKAHDYEGGHGAAAAIPYADFYKSAQVFTEEFQVCTSEVVALVVKQFH